MFSAASRTSRLFLPSRSAVRRMGGGGGSQPESQSMQAKLWGAGIDGLGGGRYNGWEPLVYTAYTAATVILLVGVGFAPETSIKVWAQGEARTRLTMAGNGDIEANESTEHGRKRPGVASIGGDFGVHYDESESKFKYVAEEMDKMPTTEWEDRKVY